MTINKGREERIKYSEKLYCIFRQLVPGQGQGRQTSQRKYLRSRLRSGALSAVKIQLVIHRFFHNLENNNVIHKDHLYLNNIILKELQHNDFQKVADRSPNAHLPVTQHSYLLHTYAQHPFCSPAAVQCLHVPDTLCRQTPAQTVLVCGQFVHGLFPTIMAVHPAQMRQAG